MQSQTTMQGPEPAQVRDGPTHPDPYPYYSRLARERPMYREAPSGAWVAAGAEAVREVLSSELCHTRPVTERVPAAMAAGAMANLYGRLVRLRDDDVHDAMKSAILAAVGGLDFRQVAELCRRRASELDAELGTLDSTAAVGRFCLSLPVQVIARLMGIGTSSFADLTSWLADYGAASAAAATGVPAASAELIDRGHRAAQGLFDLVTPLTADGGRPGPLLDALMAEARTAGCSDPADVIANAIGLMFQSYTATAALIGACLLAIARHPETRGPVASDPARLRALIQEVLRCDPSTNNTIRFAARDGVIAGQPMRQGDVIIVSLAAASRDPRLNRDPDTFDLDRRDRRYLEFGAGRHACPADKLAPLMAEVAVSHLLGAGVPLESLASSVRYAPSAFVRAPTWLPVS